MIGKRGNEIVCGVGKPGASMLSVGMVDGSGSDTEAVAGRFKIGNPLAK